MPKAVCTTVNHIEQEKDKNMKENRKTENKLKNRHTHTQTHNHIHMAYWTLHTQPINWTECKDLGT